MAGNKRQRTALFSVYEGDREFGLETLAQYLVTLGWNILASSGTAKFLKEKGVERVRDVAELVGEPILGHRVVTLSREIHAGLLAREDKPEDMTELERIGVPFIDLVYVTLYPLAEEVNRPEATLQSVLEKTDIGGPTLIRSAAKGRRLVVVHPNQFDGVMMIARGLFLEDNEQPVRGKPNLDPFLSALAADAERLVSVYCQVSSVFHHRVSESVKRRK